MQVPKKKVENGDIIKLLPESPKIIDKAPTGKIYLWKSGCGC